MCQELRYALVLSQSFTKVNSDFKLSQALFLTPSNSQIHI